MANTANGASQSAPDGETVVVQQSECIESIAFEHGLFWETIWTHPSNSRLKQERKSRSVLKPGDEVFVPAIRTSWETAATEKRHRFVCRGVPSKLQIQLLDEDGNPRGNLDYCVIVDGSRHSDRTTADGWVRIPIKPNARKAKLILKLQNGQEVYDLNLGNLDPVTQTEGVRQRLRNLGFDCGDEEGEELAEQTITALREFQHQYQLTESGKPDQATQAKLVEVYGC